MFLFLRVPNPLSEPPSAPDNAAPPASAPFSDSHTPLELLYFPEVSWPPRSDPQH